MAVTLERLDVAKTLFGSLEHTSTSFSINMQTKHPKDSVRYHSEKPKLLEMFFQTFWEFHSFSDKANMKLALKWTRLKLQIFLNQMMNGT